MNNYLEKNKAAWNLKAVVHYGSKFYDNDSFMQGRLSIPDLDRELLGDIKGLSAIHLQCHFGQDTISLSRMGAKAIGVDLSDTAIELAEKLAKECQTDTTFLCCDVYDLPEIHPQQYDLCYSSYGTIGWLPDINRWASVVAKMTRQGGRFVFAEFHPIIWMYDDLLENIQFSYFNSDPIEETIEGTYADRATPQTFKTVGWNHGLSEVVQALIDHGFELELIREYPYSPYDVFHGMVKMDEGKYIIEKFGDKMPLVYALVCRKQ